MRRPSLLDHFSALDDPRQLGKVRYPLPEIMLLIRCATLSGAGDFVGTRLWGPKKLRFCVECCRSNAAFPRMTG